MKNKPDQRKNVIIYISYTPLPVHFRTPWGKPNLAPLPLSGLSLNKLVLFAFY